MRGRLLEFAADLTAGTVSAGMALVQGYELDGPDAVAQTTFGLGEGVLAVPESLILKATDEIRAGG